MKYEMLMLMSVIFQQGGLCLVLHSVVDSQGSQGEPRAVEKIDRS